MDFQKITIERIAQIEKYYTLRPNKSCDSSVLDAFLWKQYFHTEYCIWEGRALLTRMQRGGKRYFSIPYCREEDLVAAFAALEQYAERAGIPFVIEEADEHSVALLDLPKERYEVTELPELRDYLYRREKLTELRGSMLSEKRSHIRHFLEEYEGRYEYRPIDAENWQEVWDFLKDWIWSRDAECSELLASEIDGTYDVLRHIGSLPVRSAAIYIDGRVQAFSLGCYNETDKMAVISVEKANVEMEGLYQFINQQFLLHAFPEAELVNREDDAGVPGLREAKESYEPIGYARKFRICRR